MDNRSAEGNVMRWIKWAAILVVVAVAAGFLHWSLPSRDVVRIVGTEVKRTDVEVSQGGESRTVSEDIRLINAMSSDGAPRVYRNQDTGFGWPPFFKFDSSNLAAMATDAVSTEDDPRWVVITHYGWRIPFLSQYPNAVAIRPAEGADETLIPWFNIVVVVALVALTLLARRWILARFGG